MNYLLKPTRIFLKQASQLSIRAKELIGQKLKIVKHNPYHFKKVTGFELHLFRIRFSNRRKELRLVYAIKNKTVILICILDRSKNYTDLLKILKQLGLE